MFRIFQKDKSLNITAQQIYGSIVTQARDESFYNSFSVPDTVEGRFEMIVIHIFIVMQNWQEKFGSDDELSKLIIETFFKELEHTLREMGIGDLSVPKRMQKLADSFYGRLYAYKNAIDKDDMGALAAALKRNLYAIDETNTAKGDPFNFEKSAENMTQYVRISLQHIATQDELSLRSGKIEFQNPQNVL